MNATAETVADVERLGERYKYGFITDIEAETAPKGLNEDTVRFISAKKEEPEWMREWRMLDYKHYLREEEQDRAKGDW